MVEYQSHDFPPFSSLLSYLTLSGLPVVFQSPFRAFR